jgi:monoamine oxidase
MSTTSEIVNQQQTTNVSVAIVGGGLAGMSAAWELFNAGIRSLVVLESNDRVGGRTFNRVHSKIDYLEMGGTWIGATQTAVLEIARQFGIQTKEGKVDGPTMYGYQNTWTVIERSPDEHSSFAQQDFAQISAKFELLSQTVSVEAPWTTPNAIELDHITAGDWIAQNTTTPEARTWIESRIRHRIAGDLNQVSLLFILYFIRTRDTGFLSFQWDETAYRLIGGTHTITLKIAERLGERIRLNHRVRIITDYNSERVCLSTDQGVIHAEYAIVGMMPKDVGKIHFNPPLPKHHQALIAGWQQTSWIKFYTIYPRPLWWGKVESGHFYCMEPQIEVFDASPLDGSYGVLIGFFDPKYSDLDETDRRSLAMQALSKIFTAEAAHPDEYIEIDYNKQAWTGGCVAALPPGLLTQAGHALRQPVGRIYWAGTERSMRWMNYMDGAVRSGQYAAQQILSRMALTEAEKV